MCITHNTTGAQRTFFAEGGGIKRKKEKERERKRKKEKEREKKRKKEKN